MSHDTTPEHERDAEPGTEPVDAAETELVEAGELDGEPDAVDPREEREMQAQLERELRFDGFEQGLQG